MKRRATGQSVAFSDVIDLLDCLLSCFYDNRWTSLIKYDYRYLVGGISGMFLIAVPFFSFFSSHSGINLYTPTCPDHTSPRKQSEIVLYSRHCFKLSLFIAILI